MIEREWFGLYRESWQGEIVEEAFSHPAKFSRALIRRIYRHALEQGYIRPGDTIADPFAGVGLGALDAMRYGLHYHGVELEPRFVALAQQNIDLWNARYAAAFPGWGTAQLYQGDSRQLAAVLREAGACVASPPYTDSMDNGNREWLAEQMRNGRVRTTAQGENIGKRSVSLTMGNYGDCPGQLGAMPEGSLADAAVSSPPFSSTDTKPSKLGAGRGTRANGDGAGRNKGDYHYPDSPGQLAQLPEGDVDAIVSSPPYADSVDGTGEGPGARFDHRFHSADNATKRSSANGYGSSDGNLGAMGAGACVSSPPFEASNWVPNENMVILDNRPERAGTKTAAIRYGDRQKGQDYGDTDGNIGNDTGTTFWEAARAIMEQVHAILRPGGYALWVTGNFVRGGEVVDFGRQWLTLCEAVGFVAVEHITAWKIEPGPTQLGMFGDDKDMTIERLSFFRRLANKRNPAAKVESEDVWIVRKPE